MVFVNEVKYACQSCIKGHRSSSCHHTDRPLFEIKKKGRPISQCESCRELRKSRRLHVKCVCEGRKVCDEEGLQIQSYSSNGKKTMRKIPTIPTLPNGLKDVISKGTPAPAHPKAKITSLLNPCKCQDKLTCKCTPSTEDSAGNSTPLDHTTVPNSPLHLSLAGPARQDSTVYRRQKKESKGVGPYPPRSCCANKRRPATEPVLGGKNPTTTEQNVAGSHALDPNASASKTQPLGAFSAPSKFGPPLPIIITPNPATTPGNTTAPASTVIMNMWTCLCGSSCQCLGCKMHHGAAASDEPEVLCDENCPTCVDNEAGPELPPEGVLGVIIYDPYQQRLAQRREDGTWVRHRRKRSIPLPGIVSQPLGIAFSGYEENAELGWEDAEGSPDPDFAPLPPVDEEEIVMKDGKGNEKMGLPSFMQVEPPSQPVRKNMETTTMHTAIRSCCVKRL